MASCGSKQKKFLTLKQKVDVIKEVQLGRHPPEVAKSFGICKSEVYKNFEIQANYIRFFSGLYGSEKFQNHDPKVETC